MKPVENEPDNDPQKQNQIRGHYDEDYYRPLLEGYLKKDRFTLYRQQMVFGVYSPEKGERVLDLGCGVGTFTFELASREVDVVGLDYADESIKICRELAEKLKLKADFQLADVADTGLESNSFDVIIAADLTEHLYPEVFKMFVKESKRLLRTGGKLIVWTPNPGHVFEFLKMRNIILKRDEGHVGYKTIEELTRDLTGEGFKIKRAYHRHSHLPVWNWFERMTQWFLPFMRRRNAVLAVKGPEAD